MRTISVKAFERRKETFAPEYVRLALENCTIADGMMTFDDDKIRQLMKKPIRGLGDVIAVPAQLIARGIDAVAGTYIEACKSCAEEKEKLNKSVPVQVTFTRGL